MKYYALLLTHLETEMDKKWEDLTDEDLEEMDKKAYDDLVHIIDINDPKNFSFRHYKTFDDLCDELDM
jgi:hypothetical protein